MNLNELKKIIRKEGLHAKKSYSQNFLHNEQILSRIVETIPEKMGFYVEIGGGLGALTDFAIKRELFPLSVVDIDQRMLETLNDKFSEKAKIIDADGAKLQFSSFYKEKKGFVFGNLPYQVSSPVVMNTCYQSSFLDGAVFLLQKEVAQKFCAEPSSRDFGPIAALIKKVGYADYMFSVAPENFYPIPKVQSAVVKIKFTNNTLQKEELKEFADTMRIIFSNRRKTLSNVFKINRLNPKILEKFEQSAKMRAEELDWKTIQLIVEEIRREK